MPQTREHFDICRLLDVPAGVIVLTKSDLADPETAGAGGARGSRAACGIVSGSSARRSACRLDDRRGARRSCGRARRARRWRAARGPPTVRARLPVDRVFRVKGFGTVVTGTLVSGSIADGPGTDGAAAGAPRQGARPPGPRTRSRPRPTRDIASPSIWAASRSRTSRGATRCASPSRFAPTRRFDVAIDLLPDAQAASARRASALSSGNERDAWTSGNRRSARRRGRRGRGEAGRFRLRPHPAGIARGRDARRSLHPPRVFAVGDHWRRRRARSEPRTKRHPHASRHCLDFGDWTQRARIPSGDVEFVEEFAGAGLPTERAGRSCGFVDGGGRPRGRSSGRSRACDDRRRPARRAGRSRRVERAIGCESSRRITVRSRCPRAAARGSPGANLRPGRFVRLRSRHQAARVASGDGRARPPCARGARRVAARRRKQRRARRWNESTGRRRSRRPT